MIVLSCPRCKIPMIAYPFYEERVPELLFSGEEVNCHYVHGEWIEEEAGKEMIIWDEVLDGNNEMFGLR